MRMIPKSTWRWTIALCSVFLVIGACPPDTTSAASRPNVLIIVADDLGFSDLGCYGSEIATPVLDSLAATGSVFSNFHAAATCSPSRAMLLTGVDHHLAGMGNMYEFLKSAPEQLGKPGYEGHLNSSVLTVAQVLKTVGYQTAISGKWHLGKQLAISQTPMARGFDRSWVLWSGWAEHSAPTSGRFFVEGDHLARYPQGRHSTEWYTDKAIEFAEASIDQQQPFFLLAAYTAPHWPLEAPADLIARQKGKYDEGFEELHRRRIAGLVKAKILNSGVPLAKTPSLCPPLEHDPPIESTESWNDLSAAERAQSARLMEVHAAMVEGLDQHIGRLFQHLKDRGQFDNTLIIFISDNGASSLSTSAQEFANPLERLGRPGTFIAIGAEWARALTGPFRLVKGYATEGGTRVPAIIKLPKHSRHRIVTEFASILDIAPTIYELTGAVYPKSSGGHSLHPLAGNSMLSYLRESSDRIHDEDYGMGWELFGRAAFRRGKWKITWTEKPFGPSQFELFDIDADPGESHDLRAMHPAEYQRLVADFEDYTRAKGVIVSRPAAWAR